MVASEFEALSCSHVAVEENPGQVHNKERREEWSEKKEGGLVRLWQEKAGDAVVP